MTCHNCRIEAAKAGKRPDGIQRFRCGTCGKTFSERKQFTFHKQVDEETAIMALRLIVEGNSIRSASRLTRLHRDTIMKLILGAGEKCAAFLAAKVRNVPVMDVQADEIWCFVGKKEGHKNPFEGDDMYLGDAWTFIAIERHSKLVLAFELGKRTETSTNRFMEKLARATHPDQPFQLTTDGLATYPSAVYRALGDRVDYAQHIKIYGQTPEGERRYSPAKVISAEKKDIYGDPDMQRICTSHIERQNGSLRQWCKRLTRLTYAFSKNWANLKAALALHFAFYNFCRVPSHDQADSGDGFGAYGRRVDTGGSAGVGLRQSIARCGKGNSMSESNWVERRALREKVLKQQAPDVWQDARSAIQNCCASFRKYFGDECLEDKLARLSHF